MAKYQQDDRRFYESSKNAWKHAKDTTNLSSREISVMAGWLLREGDNVGAPTQNAWLIARGRVIPTIQSLLRIMEHSAIGHQFVSLYLEGLTWLAKN